MLVVQTFTMNPDFTVEDLIRIIKDYSKLYTQIRDAIIVKKLLKFLKNSPEINWYNKCYLTHIHLIISSIRCDCAKKYNEINTRSLENNLQILKTQFETFKISHNFTEGAINKDDDVTLFIAFYADQVIKSQLIAKESENP